MSKTVETPSRPSRWPSSKFLLYVLVVVGLMNMALIWHYGHVASASSQDTVVAPVSDIGKPIAAQVTPSGELSVTYASKSGALISVLYNKYGKPKYTGRVPVK